jgi:hypothetical protein
VKANKVSKEEMIQSIKESLERSKIDSEWPRFIDNLYDNTNIGVYTVVNMLLLQHRSQKIMYSDAINPGRYFSPVQGFNVGCNGFRDDYNPDCFRGYFGFGTYRAGSDGGRLSTKLVFKYLKNAHEDDILRIDLQGSTPTLELITLDDNNKFSYKYGDLLYFCRYMQYQFNARDGIPYVAKNYEDTISSLLSKLKLNSGTINLKDVGAVEFVISNYETKEDSELAFKLAKFIYSSIIETD